MSCERASEWTTEQLQACSKDSTVLLWMLFKRVGQPSLVLSRQAPSLSGHFRIAKKTPSMSLATLPALQKASPAIGEIPPVHPSSPRVAFSRFVRRVSCVAFRSPRFVRRVAPRRVSSFRRFVFPKLSHCPTVYAQTTFRRLRNASRQTPRRTPCGVARPGPLS